jgi:putative colanic acid biosynthesis acetyltransferase WcaF
MRRAGGSGLTANKMKQQQTPSDNGTMNVSVCPSPHSRMNQLGRLIWGIVWALFYRPSPRPMHTWRCFLLRIFGAKLGKAVHPYPASWVWAPWNLEMGDHASLADGVDCYCVDRIRIGAHAVISQYTFLCGASHDYEQRDFPLYSKPITIGEGVWVAADVFVAPGVTIGDGAVVAARSTVTKDVEPWTVVAGTPAKVLKKREIRYDRTNK